MNKLEDFLIATSNFIMYVIILLIAIAFIATSCDFILNYRKREAIKKEWNNKVKNCILDKNYRNDCTYIIYQDKKINNHQEIYKNNNNNTQIIRIR